MTAHAFTWETLHVDQVFRSREYPVTAEEIKAFARQYDPQPFHTDEAAAVDSFFQGLAASGWHTAAMTMRLMVESLPAKGGLIGARIEELRWFRPVRPGDVLMVESRVLDKWESRSRSHHGWVRFRHTTRNQRGDTVQEFVANVLAPRAT